MKYHGEHKDSDPLYCPKGCCKVCDTARAMYRAVNCYCDKLAMVARPCPPCRSRTEDEPVFKALGGL